VLSVVSGMDAADRHEVLRGPSDGIVPVVRYRVSYVTALVPQLQLRRLYDWCPDSSWGVYSRIPYIAILSHGDAASIVVTRSVWM
jgi:hypothetical protein